MVLTAVILVDMSSDLERVILSTGDIGARVIFSLQGSGQAAFHRAMAYHHVQVLSVAGCTGLRLARPAAVTGFLSFLLGISL